MSLLICLPSLGRLLNKYHIFPYEVDREDTWLNLEAGFGELGDFVSSVARKDVGGEITRVNSSLARSCRGVKSYIEVWRLAHTAWSMTMQVHFGRLTLLPPPQQLWTFNSRVLWRFNHAGQIHYIFLRRYFLLIPNIDATLGFLFETTSLESWSFDARDTWFFCESNARPSVHF